MKYFATKLRQTNAIDFNRTSYDLDRGEITDLDKFLKKVNWCNYSYLNILKLKIRCLFLVTFFCAHATWWQHFTTLAIRVFFSPFLPLRKIPNFCRWFLWKTSWTDQRSEMASFCKITRLSSEETFLQA